MVAMNLAYLALTNVKPYSLPNVRADEASISTLLQILFGIIGALALLIIIIAGFRYIVSAGDPQKTANAKSTIIYALVGLAIAITAQAIIAFVVERVGPL